MAHVSTLRSVFARRGVLPLLAVILVAMTAALRPDDLRAQSSPGPLNLVFADYVFAFDDTTSLLEFDYQFSERGLVYAKTSNGVLGRLMLRLTLWDSASGRKVLASNWMTSNPAPAATAEDRQLMGVKYFAVPPGTYRAQVYYEDMADASRRDSAEFPIEVKSLASKKLDVSDLEFVTEVAPSEDRENMFYKNGYLLYPNVSGVITPPFLLVNSYIEIYNANTVPTSEFSLAYMLADSTGKVFYQQDKKLPRPESKAIMDVNSIVVSELPSGNYFLIAKAYNGLMRSATDSAQALQFFTVVNPDKDAEIATMAASGTVPAGGHTIDLEYAGMKEEELDLEFRKLRPIASQTERDMFVELAGVEAKGRFLTSFWQRRDPSPGTPANEYREDYQKRAEVARTLYRTPLTPHGWDSDRGRVLLQYGKPDAIDRHPHDSNRKPYEIWTYNADRTEFVFVDRTQQGSFSLVHSTAPGEARYSNWEIDYATLHRQLDLGRDD